MNIPDKPYKEQHLLITGKLAATDELVKVAKMLREETKAPISIVLLIFPDELKFGIASSKQIPHEITQELLKRVSQTIQDYLAEEVKLEDDNGISPS